MTIAALLNVSGIQFIVDKNPKAPNIFAPKSHLPVYGIDALDKLNRTKIDMVITDLSMPRMDGISFTKALRTRPDSMSIPVVIMATRFRGHLKSAGDEAGVSEWILKPLLHQQLADTVNRYSA